MAQYSASHSFFPSFLLLVLSLLSSHACSPIDPSPLDVETSDSFSYHKPLPFPHSLGVLPFENHGDHGQLAWLRQGLPDMLTTDLAGSSSVTIVSRQLLGEVLREQWLQHRGMSQKESVVRVGQISGTRYLLTGSLFLVNSTLIIDIHLLDVEDGTIVRTARSTGTLSTLPALEKELVVQIKNFFQVSDPHDEQTKLMRPRGPQKTKSTGIGSKTLPVEAESLANNNMGTGVLSTEVQLSVHRDQQLRQEAWLVPDHVWTQGLSFELGSVWVKSSSVANLKENDTFQQNFLQIPVKAIFRPDQLRVIHRSMQFSSLKASGNDSSSIRISWDGDSVTQRLFAERFQVPRRLFVRAISHGGYVVGVSSLWNWRVHEMVKILEDRSISLKIFPESFISGTAQFSQKVFFQEKDLLSFDAIVVPIPHEQRIVSVEMVTDEEASGSNSSLSSSLMQNALKHWFLDNWHPQVFEALPISEYLPENRPNVRLLVSGQGGVVRNVRVIHAPHDDTFMLDVRILISQLRRECFFDCQSNEMKISAEVKPFQARIQLVLHKDIHHVGLGEKVN